MPDSGWWVESAFQSRIARDFWLRWCSLATNPDAVRQKLLLWICHEFFGLESSWTMLNHVEPCWTFTARGTRRNLLQLRYVVPVGPVVAAFRFGRHGLYRPSCSTASLPEKFWAAMIPTVANLGVASHGLQLKGLDRNATQIPGFRGNLQSGDFCIARSSYILYWMELVIHVNEKQNTF